MLIDVGGVEGMLMNVDGCMGMQDDVEGILMDVGGCL